MLFQVSPSKSHENKKFEESIQFNTKNSTRSSPFKLGLTSNVNRHSFSNRERNLSPWQRRKQDDHEKKNPINQQLSLSIDNVLEQQPRMINPNEDKFLHETKMSDFLKKIQLSKKSKELLEGGSSKKAAESQFQNPKKKNSQMITKQNNKLDFTEEEIKKLIIYPKNQKKKEENTTKYSKFNLRWKGKDLSPKKTITIQTFYDPFQNTQKEFKSCSEKKSCTERENKKFRLKLMEKTSERNKTSPFEESDQFREGYEINHRKNSDDNANTTELKGFDFKKVNRLDSDKIFKKTFIKIKNKDSLRNLATEPSEKSCFCKQNPQNFQFLDQEYIPSEPTYATPVCQAVKRIKIQQKKSRRMKSQCYVMDQDKKSNLTIDGQSQSKSKYQSASKKLGGDEYLYKTFMNYKDKKDSNDLNITKTLGFNFHSKKSFRKKIQKIWLKPKNP